MYARQDSTLLGVVSVTVLSLKWYQSPGMAEWQNEVMCGRKLEYLIAAVNRGATYSRKTQEYFDLTLLL